MSTAALDRPMESTPVTTGVETTAAIVQDDYGTARRPPMVETMNPDRSTAVQMVNMEIATQSVRKASIVAGIGYLLLSILAGFGNYGVVQRLVTPGNAAKTAKTIMDSKGLFLLGIGSLAAVAVLDVIVALALLKFFNPVNKRVSLLAAGLRIVYAAVFAVAISQLAGVLSVLGNADQAQQGINAFNNIWNVGLTLFGLHLLVIGYLAYKSGYVPRWLGIVVAVAGFGYSFDGVATALSLGLTVKVASITFIGEVVLLLWLLIKGRRVKLSDELASSPR